MNPLHWLKSGQIKQIAASPFFNADWYLHRYPDVAASGMNAAKHYLLYGAQDLRDPGPLFSTSGYSAQHEVGKLNPLLHCIQHQNTPDTHMAGGQPADGPPLLLVGHQAEAQVFGAERSFLHMLEQAASTGATVHAILPKIGNRDYMQDVMERCHQLHVVPFGFRTGRLVRPETVSALQDLMRVINPRAVHQNTLAPEAPLIAARGLGIETVCHIRELPAEDPDLCAALEQSADALKTAIKAQSDRQVVNSKAVQTWLENPAAQFLPNTIDASFFDLPFIARDPLRVGIIGNLLNKKGIEDAIALADQTKAEIILVGPHTDDLARLAPLPSNVEHLGYIKDARDAMIELDVVLSLSHFAESYGRTVYEGMAAGRPVICYDKGTPPTLLGADLQHLVVPAGDVVAIAKAIRKFIRDPQYLRDTSDLARKRAQQLHAEAAQIDLSQIFVT